MTRERLEEMDSALQTSALLIDPHKGQKLSQEVKQYERILLVAYLELRAEVARLHGWRL